MSTTMLVLNLKKENLKFHLRKEAKNYLNRLISIVMVRSVLNQGFVGHYDAINSILSTPWALALDRTREGMVESNRED